ncbi:SMP-30/gluconolactonase/LRE family protein [Streptomyces sp. QHH-9511]|uniref:SMP-30/gluconolactonase/LRE family protein n=1 Tax=Streptomyces sp. QHH-9511 TaxID=2684468 RepID=UPI001316522E|nr:SMP-30/gluconolactonase/LRE family protein [Streptomyces sp. QHH-9511]QGZ52275.1 SMP-30/gluconolactonase/LRE family protein [Streptomyces sp. QHH-9511]
MSRPARIEVAVREYALLGEGPTWDPALSRLVWVDILGRRIHTYEPGSGRRSVTAVAQHIGAAKPRAGGGLVANLRDGIGLYDAGGAFSWLRHDPVPGRRGNDAAVAPDGSLWAGTMRYDERPGGGNLVRFAADGTATALLDEVTISNGIGWSPDASLAYYVDTPTRRVDTLRLREGRISERTPFASVEPGAGYPDGLTVDADGCVWVALWDGGQLRRYTPHGSLDRIVDLPVARPTACAFGGPALRDLYVTTARTGLNDPPAPAGSLLVLPDAGHGVPGTPFAG